MKNILVLYPNQLFDAGHLPKDVDQILLVEEPLYFGTDNKYPLYIHKQKLAFMRATMRRYAEEVLWPAGYQVDYLDFQHMKDSTDVVNRVSRFEEVIFFDPCDDVLQRRVSSAIASLNPAPQLTILDSPNFFLTRREVEGFFANKSKSSFTEFYRWQRERFNILINPDTYKPIGGKLSFENQTKKRLPKNHKLPTFQVFGNNDFVQEATQYVQKNFPDNPGELKDFPWPTNHQEAVEWLEEFIEHRLEHYGEYEDAIDGDAPWVYHSALSPLMNSGLLSPHEVVDKVLTKHEEKNLPLASVESFIRQVIGWREYMRGAYLKLHVQLRTSNTFGHNRRLTADWYKGTTGIGPVDDVIKKSLSRAYAHHVERLMIVGNIMFLCDFHPDEIYRWFMEIYIDAYDWTTAPNVYGMSQFNDGILTNKVYISSSNYVLKMSHYEKGEWCDIWDGLYWRFVEKNQERFKKHPKMKLAVSQLEKLDENRRRIISYRAEDFLKTKTAL